MKPETQKKIDELLAVLDLTEEEQWKWATARANEFWPDEDIFYGYPEKYFADLAFRLRDEVVGRKYNIGVVPDFRGTNTFPECPDSLFRWYEAQQEIDNHLKTWRWPGKADAWWHEQSQPIHWIIAALMAKELEK